MRKSVRLKALEEPELMAGEFVGRGVSDDAVSDDAVSDDAGNGAN